MLRAEPFVRVECRAKLNLVLEIVGRRPDGYHDLATVMHPVELADTLRIDLGGAGVELRAGGFPSPQGEANIAYRAATAFCEMARVAPQVRLALIKGIPSEAGLGGGSADAAGVLRGLACLHHWTDEAALHEAARSLGADVPFFLGSGAALVEGIGERLTPVPSATFAVVLALGVPGVETRWAYSRVRPSQYSDGARARTTVDLLKAGRVGEPWNAFGPALAEARPDLTALAARVGELGGGSAALTGSGSCVFCVAPDDATAESSAMALRQEGYWSWWGRSATEPLAVSLRA